MKTDKEIDMLAARICLEAVQRAQRESWFQGPEEDRLRLAEAIEKIEKRLIRDTTGGDKILARQLGHELGRQVKAPKQSAKVLEALVKKAQAGK